MTKDEKRLNVNSVPLYSVRDIVRRRVLPPKESSEDWHLALVQRNLVWNEERMARLLDSLLRGYPIGSLLFCKLAKPLSYYKMRSTIDDPGTMVDTEDNNYIDNSPQLIDGQQRIHALSCIFSDKKPDNSFEDYGEFFLKLTAVFETRIIDARKKERHLWDFIRWVKDGDRKKLGKQLRDGSYEKADFGWLKLGGFLEWDRQLQNELTAKEIMNIKDDKLIFDWIKSIDPDFESNNIEELENTGLKGDVLNNFKRLLRAWFDKKIPKVEISLDEPEDMLDVYIRSNMEGVRVSVEDAFFAAVKISWDKTEEHLKNVQDVFPVLDRMSILRILARISRKAVHDVDIWPLSLEPLNRIVVEDKVVPNPIIVKMEGLSSLTGNDSQIEKWKQLFARLKGGCQECDNDLGYALNYVHDHSFDHVLAWATRHDNPLNSNLKKVTAYLIGSTYYKFFQVLGDTYSRIAFKVALESEKDGDFPLERIIEECNKKWKKDKTNAFLLNGNRSIRSSDTPENILHHFRQHNDVFRLMLSLAQKIPFDLNGVEIEWEHIYAQALADRMQIKEGRVLHQHKDREYVWHGGNLMALDSRLNRILSDEYPLDKVFLLQKLLKEQWNPSIPEWSKALYIIPEEQNLLDQVQNKLKPPFDKGSDDRDIRVNEAMKYFEAYISKRVMRIWNEINVRFPELKAFEKIWKD